MISLFFSTNMALVYMVSENMNVKSEENRVREIINNLIKVPEPANHGRAKWDRQSSKDLEEVIQTLGKFSFFID